MCLGSKIPKKKGKQIKTNRKQNKKSSKKNNMPVKRDNLQLFFEKIH